MNIEHGREFIELAQRQNFTETAESLNITQPALSKHMLALEREFGTELLDRSRKGVQLTEAGRVLFESAWTMVASYDRARAAIEQLKRKRPIHVVGHMDDSDVAALSSMTAMIARDSYQSTVVFDRGSDDPLDLVTDGTSDLFVGYADPDDIAARGLRCIPFTASPLLCVMETSHPLAKRASVSWGDLCSQTFVRFMGDRTNPAWEQIERACEQCGYVPRVRPVSALTNVEFFSTPLQGSVLIWKATEKQIGLLIETDRRAGVPLSGEGSKLTTYAAYRPENEEKLRDFFAAAADARALFDQVSERRNGA